MILRLRLPAERDALAPLREFAASEALACGLDATQLPRVELVIEEAVTNLVMHAYKDQPGDVELACYLGPDRCVCLQLADWGPPFNPLLHPAPDTTLPLEQRPIGGLGIHLMKHMSERIEYHRDAGKNILTLYFKNRP